MLRSQWSATQKVNSILSTTEPGGFCHSFRVWQGGVKRQIDDHCGTVLWGSGFDCVSTPHPHRKAVEESVSASEQATSIVQILLEY